MRSTERPAYVTTVHVRVDVGVHPHEHVCTVVGVYALLHVHIRAISFKITCHASHSIFAMQQHYWCS